MAKYRKKVVEVKAVRWWKHGDSPFVDYGGNWIMKSEYACGACGKPLREHGYCYIGGIVVTWRGGRMIPKVVCPGAWVVEGVNCVEDVISDVEFAKIYERVE